MYNYRRRGGNLRLNSKSAFVLIFALLSGACSNVGLTPPAKKADSVYAIRIQSGDNQTGNINSTLSSSLVVLVTDKANGQIVANAEVAWAVVLGGGTLVTKYARTSPIGEAPATLQLSPAVGTNTVSATVSTGDSVTFTSTGIIGPASSATSSIVGSGPIEPDGINFSTITITLKDSSGNPIAGSTPNFSATGSSNVYGICSITNASGVSGCTLKSTTAETKILSITSPLTKIGGIVDFAPGPVSASNSSISGTSNVIANGVATSTVTITLRDASNVGVGGVVPTFSATDTGVKNTYQTCSSTNGSGISFCTFSSTKAETKIMALTSPVSITGNTVNFIAGPASSSTSSITGTGPVANDGSTNSIITIFLKDASANPLVGTAPTFTATNTGSTNVYGACSLTNASGSSTCNLASTTAETKTLSLVTPISFAGGTVVFAPGPVSAANSNITGSGPVISDGIALSNITITLKDASNIPVSGVTPNFIATDTATKNNYGTCSASNAAGVSSCTLSSSKAELKTLTITSPVSKPGGTVQFNPGPPSAVTSTISGTGTVVADGSSTSAVTITLKDANLNLIAGVTPSFSATDGGSTNAYSGCTLTNVSGVSSCTFTSTRAEVKTLTILTPVNTAGGTVAFIHGVTAITYTTINGSGPVPPDGVSTSTISISLKDSFNNPVDLVSPTFSATNTGATNVYGSCSVTNSLGNSTCTLASTTSETKTVSIVSPIGKSGGTVTFIAGAASSVNSSISGTGSVVANGSATSNVSITLKDSSNLALVGTVPTFSATNTGNGNIYGTCSATNSSGIASCTLASTKAEVKTLSIISPINKAGSTVSFIAGAISASTSQISGTGPVLANGIASSTVTVVLYDVNTNPVAGNIPTFSATNTGSSNVYTACSTSNSSGSSTCTLKSTSAEVKTLSLSTPVALIGGAVTFTAGVTTSTYTTITGTGPVTADGVSNSLVTITLKDAFNNAVSGATPTYTATNTNTTNVYGTCSASSSSGVSTCTLTSTYAETKTLTLATPISKAGGTVIFTAGAASIANSSIVGTGPVLANGTASSTVTIILKDANNFALVGTVPTFSATNAGGGNIYGVCTASSGTGTSICSLSSTKAQVKTLSIATPIVKSGGTVTFNAGAVSASTSMIGGSGPVIANGVATSTVTVTLYDANNNPVAGSIPSFSATDTGSSNSYGTCSATNATGSSTCSLTSTKAEIKTLSITAPVNKADGTVSFIAGTPVAANSTITGTGPVGADGMAASTVTVTLRDVYNNPVSGMIPTFTATNSGGFNTYGSCLSSNSSGQSSCTLKSTRAEIKTLAIATPVVKSGGTISFVPAASPTNSSIVGTGPVTANGSATSTITVTLRDYQNLAIQGITPTFTATNTGNSNMYYACSSTNASGVSTCTLSSLQAETKTLQVTTPIVFSGGNVVFQP